MAEDESEAAEGSRNEFDEWKQAIVEYGLEANYHGLDVKALYDSLRTPWMISDEQLAHAAEEFVSGWPIPADPIRPLFMWLNTETQPQNARPEWIQSAAKWNTIHLGFSERSVENILKLPELSRQQALFAIRGIDFLSLALESTRHMAKVTGMLRNISTRLADSIPARAMYAYITAAVEGKRTTRGAYLYEHVPEKYFELEEGTRLFVHDKKLFVARSGPIRQFRMSAINVKVDMDLDPMKLVVSVDGYETGGVDVVRRIGMDEFDMLAASLPELEMIPAGME